METRTLGSLPEPVSVVGYGAWEAGGDMWGERASDDRVVAAMTAALDAGMNWIDTAEVYGMGRSEELVGRVRKQRRDFLVFTKVAHGTRPDEVRAALEASLRRLDVDQVDLYQIHWPDDRFPVEEMWGEMVAVKDAGLTRAIGVSNFDRDLVERCTRLHPVDSVQNQFSLLHRDDEAELLPWLAERGIGYLAYGPLAFGLLGGTIREDHQFHDSDWRSGTGVRLGYYDELFAPGKIEQSVARVDALRPLAERAGTDLATLSLRAAIDTVGVTAVIAGSLNPDHVRANAQAGVLNLDRSVLDEVRGAVAAR